MAKRQSMRLDPGLVTLLLEQQSEAFTMQSLVNLYAEKFGLGDNASISELRKWLYRRVVYLVKREFLVKLAQDGEAAEYQVTSLFKKAFPQDQLGYVAHDLASSAQLDELKHRLSQYHVDMLACAGECKEYQRLVTEFPQLRPEIEQLHQTAKDRSSELLGQIRAINNLLQQPSPN